MLAAATRPYALVIEDDPDAADVASGMLNVLGYETDIAPDGHAALFSLSARAPDLLLVDICLPQMDGVTLMKVARRVEETQNTPVVCCSAVYPPNSSVAKILGELGVRSYLSKPFNMAALRSAVKMAHPTGPAGSASVTRPTLPAARRPTPPKPRKESDKRVDPTSDTATLVLRLEDVVARVQVSGREEPMLVERASQTVLNLRSADDLLALDCDVLAAITIRKAIDDSMREFDIRLKAVVEDKRTTPRGTRYRLGVRVCHPADGMKLVAEEVARI